MVLATILTVRQARDMGGGLGTMGVGPVTFMATWAVMMAAMMVPSLLPTATLYLRSVHPQSHRRGAVFVSGYVLLWTASGSLAYLLALAADEIVRVGGWAPRLFASLIFAATAAYALTPMKQRMLGHCRNPLGLIIEYGAYEGRLRDLRAGLHHGLTCLGCCWSLMALMIVFGMMNVLAMVAIAIIVGMEKLWRGGVPFSRFTGGVSAVLAIAVLFAPGLAVGLTGTSMSM